MARLAVIVRVARLLQMMQGRRFRPTENEIARELGVSRRTACRYLNAMDEARIVVPPTRPKEGEYA